MLADAFNARPIISLILSIEIVSVPAIGFSMVAAAFCVWTSTLTVLYALSSFVHHAKRILR
jgi:hypothetical protein